MTTYLFDDPAPLPRRVRYMPYGNVNLPGQLAGPTAGTLDSPYNPNQLPGAAGPRYTMKYFPFLTDLEKTTYQTAEGNPLAYQRMIGQMAPQGSYAREWLGDQYSDTLAAWKNASLGNPDLLLTDYLEQEAPKLAQKYAGLRGWERGEGAPTMGAGRAVYR